MKRYEFEQQYGELGQMRLESDGEWIRYDDHVEAMKRIAGASAQHAEPVAWLFDNEEDGKHWYDTPQPMGRPVYAAPAPIASPAAANTDAIGVILEMREQAREARQSDPSAGILADHPYADLLDEWANRLERHDGRLSGLVRDYIEGMSVSVDVSTGEHDAGNRYYGFVTEVMDDPDDKHGVTLLVQGDVRPNFRPSASQDKP